jgi:NTP pyrophosphatase (non-canonical NTP hydrolase)
MAIPLERGVMEMSYSPLVVTDNTLEAIRVEAIKAHEKHGVNSMLYADYDRAYAILAEECGEVAHELNDAICENRNVNHQKLIAELIQVAAMAATMIEAAKAEVNGVNDYMTERE